MHHLEGLLHKLWNLVFSTVSIQLFPSCRGDLLFAIPMFKDRLLFQCSYLYYNIRITKSYCPLYADNVGYGGVSLCVTMQSVTYIFVMPEWFNTGGKICVICKCVYIWIYEGLIQHIKSSFHIGNTFILWRGYVR